MKPLRQRTAKAGGAKTKPNRTTSTVVRALIDETVSHGYSMASVAEAIGVSGSALSQWRMGRSSPNLVTTEAFAQVLGYRLVLERIEP